MICIGNMNTSFPKWVFDFPENYSWTYDFVLNYGSNDFVIMIDEDDGQPPYYSWYSPHLEELSDVDLMAHRAAALKALFDGAMLLHRRGSFYHRGIVAPNGTSSSSFNKNIEFPFEPFSCNWKSSNCSDHSRPIRHVVSRNIHLAHYCDTIKNMLIFLGYNGVSWITLYAMKDFIKSFGWDDNKIANASGCNTQKLKLFSQTANNFAAIGPLARHGQTGWQPPSVPMSLHDATELILSCVDAFCEERAHQKGVGKP